MTSCFVPFLPETLHLFRFPIRYPLGHVPVDPRVSFAWESIVISPQATLTTCGNDLGMGVLSMSTAHGWRLDALLGRWYGRDYPSKAVTILTHSSSSRARQTGLPARWYQ